MVSAGVYFTSSVCLWLSPSTAIGLAVPRLTPPTCGWYVRTVDTTPTCTVNGSLSFPWLSTALRTTV